MLNRQERDALNEMLYRVDANAVSVLRNQAYHAVRQAISNAAGFFPDEKALKALVLDAYGVVAAEMQSAG